jgi:D-serine deaminase-like pyridoxal phosphate-dependent protein
MATVDQLDTPAVTIDLDRVEANIKRAQALTDAAKVANRPHIKTHKIPAIARLQMAAGAVGITCQKLDEVDVFTKENVADDVLVTFNIVGEKKTDRLLELSSRVRRLAVVADNETVLRGLSAAGVRHSRDVPVLVECDVGFGRNGVQSPAAALALARLALSLPRLRFEGLMAYPSKTPNTNDFMGLAVDLFRAAKIDLPVISGGGTPALKHLADFPLVTEHRAGTYVYNDVMMVSSGAATFDDCAMHVHATVVSVPTPDRAIVDAGSKVLTREQYYVTDFGRIVEYPDAVVSNLSEEHGIIDLSRSAEKPRVGETVRIIPNHCCVVSNMVDTVFGIRAQAIEITWPVAARGGVH